MEIYVPLVSAVGFDCSKLDEAQIFLLASKIIHDPEFHRLRMQDGDDAAETKWLLRKYGNSRGEKDPTLKDVPNPFKRCELRAADTANKMTEREKAALRERCTPTTSESKAFHAKVTRMAGELPEMEAPASFDGNRWARRVRP